MSAQPQPRSFSRRQFLGTAAGGTAVLFGGAAVLAACGSDDGGSPTTTATGTSGSNSVAVGDVRVLSWFGPSQEAARDSWAAVGAAFTASGGGHVAFDVEPNDSYLAAQTAKCRANALQDVVIELPGLPYAPIFPCLRTLSDADIGSLTTELTGWGGAIKTAGEQGYFGVPVGQTGLFWYFNRSLFSKAGLDPNAAPQTWDEFAAACTALKAAGITPMGISGADGYIPWWMWNTWMAQYFPAADDGVKFSDGTHKISELKAALAYVQRTYAEGWWDDGASSKLFSDVEADFIAGRVAMVCGATAGALHYALWDEKLGKDAYGVFAGPTLPDGKAGQPVPFSAASVVLGVADGSDVSDSAFDFVRFAGSRDGQHILTKGGFALPNRTDLDVKAITGSLGAEQINAIYARYPGVTPAGTFFKAPAQAMASSSQITEALKDNSLDSFLEELDAAQASVD